MLKKFNSPLWVLSSSITLWVFICIGCITNMMTNEEVSLFSATLGLFIQVIILFYWIYAYSGVPKDNSMFYWILLSNIFLFITDINFYVIDYVLNYKINAVSISYFITYYMPFLAWVQTGIVSLYKLITPSWVKVKHFLILMAVLLTGNLIVIAFFLLPILDGYTHSSDYTLYQIIDFIYKLLFFDIIILCLVCARETWLVLYLVGSSIVISSDFLFSYAATSSEVTMGMYGELFWFLGTLLILCGVLTQDKTKNHNMSYLFNKYDAIKSRLVFLSFGVGVFSFLLFLVPMYFFDLINKSLFSIMPFFIMIYSILVILLSRYLGQYFEEPFKLLANNVERFINNGSESTMEKFRMEEFNSLQRFMFTALGNLIGNEKSKKELVQIASQAAHDIRSPITAILMLIRECRSAPESIRTPLRDASNRIYSIANNLLLRSSGKNLEKKSPEKILLSVAILSLISEKKVEYKDLNITITCDIERNAVFSFIKTDLTDLKCVLSNLINNSVESIKNKRGSINIDVIANHNCVYVSIIDSGSGMPKEVRQKIIEGNAISTKKDGFGLGFCHVRKFISESNAQLDISYPGIGGTKITMVFKEETPLSWVAKEITLSERNTVIILDDDPNIHAFWDNAFQKLSPPLKDTITLHFYDTYECVKYLKSLSQTQLKLTYIFTEYEFSRQKLNGLDVIETVQTKKAILVSGCYDEDAILKRAMLLNVKIIPKYILPKIDISYLEEEIAVKKNMDIVVLEDNKELSHVMAFLFKFRDKQVDIYHDIYVFLDSLPLYDHRTTKFCLDFDLGILINGIELAAMLHKKGYKKLYLSSGYSFQENEIPPYLTVLPDKMDLLNL